MRWLLLFLVACAPAVEHPDEVQEGTEIWWEGFPRLKSVGTAVSVIEERGLEVCPADRRDRLLSIWHPKVTFQPIGFQCGDPFPVNGCQVDVPNPVVLVSWRPSIAETALPDELGHSIWEICFDRTGEVISGTTDTYDTDFAQFVSGCRSFIANLPN